MLRSSSQESSTSLAIGRLPWLEVQNKYLDELAAEIIPRGDGVTKRDVNTATIILRANGKDAVRVCMLLFAVLIR
jgi:hypothetical protein